MSAKPTVALFGASVRALAESATAAGFDVFAADLFGDQDLLEVCSDSVRMDLGDYPNGFRRIADRWPGVPRVYCGGLENYPEVVEHFARTGPLWGCSPESLRGCREPMALPECGFKSPGISLAADGIPTDGTWLQKPIRGSAGRGIKPWFGGWLPKECSLQERVVGEPCSASFLATDDGAILIGAATQFIGEKWSGAPDFAYCGGVAPVDCSESLTLFLDRVGETLRAKYGLRGLFGVDAVHLGDDWTLLEINPRPTASMELFELVGTGRVFELHRAAFEGNPVAWKPTASVAGKAILYATGPCVLETSIPPAEDDVRFADRPAAGTKFAVGEPVATVVATASSATELPEKLKRGIVRLRNRLSASG